MAIVPIMKHKTMKYFEKNIFKNIQDYSIGLVGHLKKFKEMLIYNMLNNNFSREELEYDEADCEWNRVYRNLFNYYKKEMMNLNKAKFEIKYNINYNIMDRGEVFASDIRRQKRRIECEALRKAYLKLFLYYVKKNTYLNEGCGEEGDGFERNYIRDDCDNLIPINRYNKMCVWEVKHHFEDMIKQFVSNVSLYDDGKFINITYFNNEDNILPNNEPALNYNQYKAEWNKELIKMGFTGEGYDKVFISYYEGEDHLLSSSDEEDDTDDEDIPELLNGE